jgi:methyltransferase (TIGR00027 family)
MRGSRPSITAENTAAVRAFDAMQPPDRQVCHDAYARYFLSDRFTARADPADAISRTLHQWEKIVPGVCGAILARTCFVDECLSRAVNNRIEQLVILGAGYDTRALRFPGLQHKVKVYELDHPATQQYKLERLKRSCPDLANRVIYIPINFEKNHFGRALISHGYDRSKYTFYIWEGVSYYLPARVVDDTLFFIAGNCATGSEIVFDYFPASVVRGTCELPEARPLVRILSQFGEKIRFGISPEKIAGFLHKRGYTIVRNLSGADCRQAYFQGKAGMDATVSDLFNFAHAKVT